jgi:sensor histidine kinase regulating citrate/malate metabolism
MKEILPKPNLLPIRLDVYLKRTNKQNQLIPVKGLFQAKPYETIDCIISKVKEYYEQKQDSITEFKVDKCVLSGPMYTYISNKSI